MHVLIGYVLAHMLKAGGTTEPLLPTIRGVFAVVHRLPGRLRMRVPLLEGKTETSLAALEAEFRKVSGIESVHASRISGSILVLFDKTILDEVMVCGITLKLLGLEASADRPPDSLVTDLIKSATRNVNQFVYHGTGGILDFNSTFGLSLLLIAWHAILLKGDRSPPGGVNLLWWAYVVFRSGS